MDESKPSPECREGEQAANAFQLLVRKAVSTSSVTLKERDEQWRKKKSKRSKTSPVRGHTPFDIRFRMVNHFVNVVRIKPLVGDPGVCVDFGARYDPVVDFGL